MGWHPQQRGQGWEAAGGIVVASACEPGASELSPCWAV